MQKNNNYSFSDELGLGASVYALIIGFSYAVDTALVLDVIGGRRRVAATNFTVLGSVSNVPVAYMTWLCALSYRRIWPRGPMAFDALANATTSALLGLFLVCAKRRKGDWDLVRTPPI